MLGTLSLGFQHLFKFFFLSIAILSAILGRKFYTLNPLLLFLSIPTTLFMVSITVFFRQRDLDNTVQLLKLHNLKPANKLKSPLLKLEIILYLFSAFLSDVLAIISIIQTTMLTLLPTHIVPSAIGAFVFAVICAAYIHIHHRHPEHFHYYHRVQAVYDTVKPSITLAPVLNSLSIYTGLISSLALIYAYPPLGYALSVITVLASAYHIRALFETNFSVYFAFAMNVSVYNFTEKLSKLLRIAHITAPSKNIIALSSNMVAISFLCVHYLSNQRKHIMNTAISNVEDTPKINR